MTLIDQGRRYTLKCRNSSFGNVGELTSKFCSRFAIVGVVILLSVASAFADAQRGTLVHEATLHIAPNEDAAKLGQAGRGHELIVIESSRDWVHVEALLTEPHKSDSDDDEEHPSKTVTGWVMGKALVTTLTPNGDKIIFGEAADSEDQASRRRGRRDAARDAMRLYYRVYDLFPSSPLAAGALYRAAHIW